MGVLFLLFTHEEYLTVSGYYRTVVMYERSDITDPKLPLQMLLVFKLSYISSHLKLLRTYLQ